MNVTDNHPDDLLPWYVNGTLSEPERDRVAGHLTACARCREEVAFLESVAGVVRRPVSKPAAGFALKRLQRDLRRSAPQRVFRERRGWMAFAAAALLVITVQTAWIVRLSAPGEGFLPAGEVIEIKVQFADEATAGQIRALLHRVQATIVDGPSAVGLYTLTFTDSPPADERQRRMAELARQSAIVVHLQGE